MHFADHSKPTEYVDFLLIKAPLETMAQACLGASQAAENAHGQFDIQPVKPGFFLRLLMRLMGIRYQEPPRELYEPLDPAEIEPSPPLRIRRGADLWPGAPIARAAGLETDMASFMEMHDRMRLSSPPSAPEWTLIECFEMASGMSMNGFQLSMTLPGQDVLYFRAPGANPRDIHYDFHLYRDGNTLRRVLCHSTLPTTPDAEPWWEGIADGPLTEYEDPALYRGATQATLLDLRKIDAILAPLGPSLDTLFDPAPRPVLVIDRAGQ